VSNADRAEVIERTRAWLERFVIGLGLCPFAARPFRLERIGYVVCEAIPLEGVYSVFLQTLEAMVLADPEVEETTLLILSRGLRDFDDYLDALARIEQAVADAGLEDVIQLASFHPDYRFADAPADDPANYSNRSPYPMFHLIRQEGLAEALASYREPETIPERNIRTLRGLGTDRIRAILSGD